GESTWRRVPVGMLWHPLLWLPEHLARPGMFPEGKDGALVEEDIAEWAFRVAIEITQAGLYDVNTAQWVDVLARVGINVSSEEGIARVRAWQAGGADAV